MSGPENPMFRVVVGFDELYEKLDFKDNKGHFALCDYIAEVGYDGYIETGTVLNTLREAMRKPFLVQLYNGNLAASNQRIDKLLEAMKKLSQDKCTEALLKEPNTGCLLMDDLHEDVLPEGGGELRKELEDAIQVRDKLLNNKYPQNRSAVSMDDESWLWLVIALLAVGSTGRSATVLKPGKLPANLLKFVPGPRFVTDTLSEILRMEVVLKPGIPAPGDAIRSLHVAYSLLEPSKWVKGLSAQYDERSWVIEVQNSAIEVRFPETRDVVSSRLDINQAR